MYFNANNPFVLSHPLSTQRPFVTLIILRRCFVIFIFSLHAKKQKKMLTVYLKRANSNLNVTLFYSTRYFQRQQ